MTSVESLIITVGGRVRGATQSAKSPNWLAKGAIAFWDLQESSGDFLDQGDNLWDVPRPSTNYRRHTLFVNRSARQMNGGYGSAAHVDARIVSELSVALVCRAVTAGYGGIFCRSTGPTDCLWGLGTTSGGQFAMFDKRHPLGGGVLGALAPPEFAPFSSPACVLFMTRSPAGVCKLYTDGRLVHETAAVAAPVIVGDEVIAIGGINEFDSAGLWDTELSEAVVKSYTKECKPWLDL